MLRAVNQTGKDKWSYKASVRKENIKDTEPQDENLSTFSSSVYAFPLPLIYFFEIK